MQFNYVKYVKGGRASVQNQIFWVNNGCTYHFYKIILFGALGALKLSYRKPKIL